MKVQQNGKKAAKVRRMIERGEERRRSGWRCPGCGAGARSAMIENDWGGFPVIRCTNKRVKRTHPHRDDCGVLDSRRADRRTGVPYALEAFRGQTLTMAKAVAAVGSLVAMAGLAAWALL